jgi:hypothetical protein
MNGDEYNTKCDVFSFAIVLACFGVPDGTPRSLANQSGMQFARMNSQGGRLSLDALKWPQAMKDLVNSCWDHDPTKRPSFDEIGEEISNWRETDFREIDGGGDDQCGRRVVSRPDNRVNKSMK